MVRKNSKKKHRNIFKRTKKPLKTLSHHIQKRLQGILPVLKLTLTFLMEATKTLLLYATFLNGEQYTPHKGAVPCHLKNL